MFAAFGLLLPCASVRTQGWDRERIFALIVPVGYRGPLKIRIKPGKSWIRFDNETRIVVNAQGVAEVASFTEFNPPFLTLCRDASGKRIEQYTNNDAGAPVDEVVWRYEMDGLKRGAKVWDESCIGTFADAKRLAKRLYASQGKGGYRVVSLAFSPDGRTLATADDVSVRIYDVATGTERPFPIAGIERLEYLDGKRLLIASRDDVEILDPRSGARRRAAKAVRVGDLPGSGYALNADRTRLASVPFNGGVSIWNLTTGDLISHVDSQAKSVAYLPDGRLKRLMVERVPTSYLLEADRTTVSADGTTAMRLKGRQTATLWDAVHRRSLWQRRSVGLGQSQGAPAIDAHGTRAAFPDEEGITVVFRNGRTRRIPVPKDYTNQKPWDF